MLKQIPRIPEGWTTFFLVLAMIYLTGYAIDQAELTPGLDVLMTIGFYGYIAGFFLAKSRFSSRTATLFAIVYGAFAIFYLLGRRFMPEGMIWSHRVADMAYRQADWINKAIYGGTSRDALIFTMHTSVIFWVLGVTAAWFTFREKKIWRVVLPAGLVLLSVVYYYYGPKPLWLYLVLYILISFLYISRTFLAEQESEWIAAVVRYERSITANFMAGGLILALIALLGAWTAPPLAANATVNQAIGGVNSPLRRLQDNWTRLFSSLRSYGTATNDSYSGSLTLGGPRNVGDSLIMDVFVPQELPYAYWQAVVFETYDDGAWSSPPGERVMIIPDDGPINVPETQSREAITQTVRNFVPNAGTIYGMPEVIGSDKQLFVSQQLDSRGNSLVSAVQSRYVLQQGDIYNTRSRMSVATSSQLRAAGRDYPDWIEPYLQVPDEMTGRTLALAGDLVSGQPTVYDAAVTVQNYLRQAIKYNDQIQAPPPSVEPIDYVLFDLQEGYCNYYATAMVMMLRSQRIPARMVAGYAAGEFIKDANVYRVRAKDAHTWVEVYFPTYGWVQFEPTSAIPVFNRPEGESPFGLDVPATANPGAVDALGPDRGGLLPEDDLLEGENTLGDGLTPLTGPGGFSLQTLFSAEYLPVTLAVLLVLVAGAALYLGHRINQRVEGDIRQSYSRLGQWSRWLGHAPQINQTPYERADVLVSIIPAGRRPIRTLTAEFVRYSFSRNGHSPNGVDPQAEWRELRPLLLRQTLAHQAGLARGWMRERTRRWRFWR